MLGRARQNGLIDIRVHNIRDYTDNKHRKTDDYPFGGGAGMVMMAQPIFDCVDAVLGGEQARRILLSPRGRTLNQKIAKELAGEERLLLLCGHYEGVDERVMSIMDEELSIGDYVLTGGELPAMVLTDCLAGSFRAYWAAKRARRTSRFPTVCWNTRSIRGRRSFAAWKCRRFCSTAITQKFRNGGSNSAAQNRDEPPRPLDGNFG
jgi:tRNA G37 N-methylase TrmD